MGVVVDGDRSIRRLTHGKKLLSMIEELNIPAKAVVRDGFFIKARQDKGVTNILVKAPAGATVVCSTNTGIKVASADYWIGMFNPTRDVFLKDYAAPPSGTAFTTSSGTGFYEEAVARVLFDPEELTSPYQHTPPFPVLEASLTEAHWLFIRGKSDKYKLQRFLNGYVADGTQDNMYGFGMSLSASLDPMVMQFFPISGGMNFAGVLHQKSTYVTAPITGLLVVAMSVHSDNDTWTLEGYTFQSVFAAMPSGLRNLSLYNGSFYAAPCGSYAFKDSSGVETLLHCTSYPLISQQNALSIYLDSHPEEWPWVLAVSITRGAVSYAYSSDQFLSILDTIAAGEITRLLGIGDTAGAYAVAFETMWLLLPRPNYQYVAPYDSVMFHGPETAGGEENVYTWTRAHGAFKFTNTGISAVTLTLPADVTGNPSVAPCITHAGGGLYLCVCEKLGPTATDGTLEVKSVHVGSPFGTWSQLPSAPLVHIRPIEVTAESVFLLGIQRVYNSVTAKDEYFFSFFRGGVWYKCGKVDVDPVGITNWSVCLYGETEAVAKSRAYPTQPAVMPQMPCPLYEEYPYVAP